MIQRPALDDDKTQLPLLFGRALDGKGGGVPVSWEEVQHWKPTAERPVLWIHLCRTEPGVQGWLEQLLDIPEPTAELLTSDESRPRAFREGHALVATLRGINFNPGAEPEDMVSLQLWSDGHRVVTLRRLPLQTPRAVLQTIDKGAGPTDAGALITALTERLIEQMGASIVDMNEAIDALEDDEERLDTDEALTKIATIRRNCLALKRHMSPEHEALQNIAHGAPEWFEDHDRREIAESIDRLRRFLDDIDISKESAVVLQDEIRARSLASSERTQHVLTVVAGVFLPLSFITGLLGINVAGMPLTQPDSGGFWIIVAVCCAILVVELMLFRKWKFF